ncbi:MAG: GAF domain-containing protein [Herpetosiphon sp.]|nr:GAF domain-containing protein [Herpetosiphon sp.]
MSDIADSERQTMLGFARSRMFGLFHVFWITSLVLGVIANVTLFTFLQRFDTSLGFDLRDMEILAKTTLFSLVAFNIAWIGGFLLMFWLVWRTIKRLPAMATDDPAQQPTNTEAKLLRDEKLNLQEQITAERQHTAQLLESILPLGVKLVSEPDDDRLFHTIVSTAKSLAPADAATLYIRTSEEYLKPVTMQTSSLNLDITNPEPHQLPIPMLRLHGPNGEPNHRNITTSTVHRGASLNVDDVYSSDVFDFSGPKAFDFAMNYHSMSLLTVPLKNSQNDVIGVLQLVNALDREQKQIVPFSRQMQQRIEVLAQLVAAALVVHEREA